MSSTTLPTSTGAVTGGKKDMAVADADAGFIRPNEEQAMTATDDSPKAVTGNFLEPLNASLNGHTIKLAPERHREEVLPARKSSLRSSTMDTVDAKSSKTSLARRTSGYAGSYDDGQSSTAESATEDEEEQEIVEFIMEEPSSMQQRLDEDANSDLSSEKTSVFTLGPNSPRVQKRVVSNADGGVGAGFGLDKRAEPASYHMGNGVACRYYNRARCSKGTSCPWSHAPDTYSLRSRSDGKNVCIYFIHNDKCRFDSKGCNYSHRKADLAPWDDQEIARQLSLKLEERKTDLKTKKVDKKEKRKSTSQDKPPSTTQVILGTTEPRTDAGAAILSALSDAPQLIPKVEEFTAKPSPDSSFTSSSKSIPTPSNISIKDINDAAQINKKKRPTQKPQHPYAMNASIPPPRQQYAPYMYTYLPQQPQLPYPYSNAYYVPNWMVPLQTMDYLQSLRLGPNWTAVPTQNQIPAPVPQIPTPLPQPSNESLLPLSNMANGASHAP